MSLALPIPRTSLRLVRNLSWRDPDTECQLVLSQPATDPELWTKYCEGALARYRRSGIECAVDTDEMHSSKLTLMFIAALDNDGRVIGGLRAVGPLRSACESHAFSEWAGQPGQQDVWQVISDRLPAGILELKTAWVSADRDRNRPVVKALARAPIHMMGLLGIRFCMGTAAHALDRWSSSGGVVATIAATPYPDERYQTKMIWWDSREFAKHAEPEQVSKAHIETTSLIHQLYSGVDVDASLHSVV